LSKHLKHVSNVDSQCVVSRFHCNPLASLLDLQTANITQVKDCQEREIRMNVHSQRLVRLRTCRIKVPANQSMASTQILSKVLGVSHIQALNNNVHQLPCQHLHPFVVFLVRSPARIELDLYNLDFGDPCKRSGTSGYFIQDVLKIHIEYECSSK
jgi:hypothetical protein